jgi:ribosomal protein S18 acetylase RimI-like enzyme
MRVEPATPANLEEIRSTFADARQRQRELHAPLWPEFSDALILREINSGSLHRVVDGSALVGVFAAMYHDEAIWNELERHAHIYLHRIARASSYPGRGLLDAVLAWALARCEELGREGLRMDTWSKNDALIEFYGKLGFRLIRHQRIGVDPRLPPHYEGLEVALLERPLKHERHLS